MATLAIGDIHGNRLALGDLLRKVEVRLQEDDTVVFLGDYIDRGPDPKGCIDLILEFRERVPATVVALLGNHEDWMLRSLVDPSRHSWVAGMEAFDTVTSYSPAAARELRSRIQEAGVRLFTDRVELPYALFFDAMPRTHLEFFQTLPTHALTTDVLCAHGGLDPAIPSLDQQGHEDFLWGTEEFVEKYEGPPTVVYGHWGDVVVDSNGWPSPRMGRHTVGIDSIAHGVLTAVRFPGREILQSARHEIPASSAI